MRERSGAGEAPGYYFRAQQRPRVWRLLAEKATTLLEPVTPRFARRTTTRVCRDTRNMLTVEEFSARLFRKYLAVSVHSMRTTRSPLSTRGRPASRLFKTRED